MNSEGECEPQASAPGLCFKPNGTLVRAETPLAVLVIAGRGGAPQLSIITASAGACLMLVAQEGEGKDAGSTF